MRGGEGWPGRRVGQERGTRRDGAGRGRGVTVARGGEEKSRVEDRSSHARVLFEFE
jgi:hypothetical protein